MKKLLIALMAVTMVFMVACGGGASSASDEVITLSGYRYGDPADPQFDVDRAIIAAFEAENPNIKIEWEYASGEAYHDKLKSLVAANTLPDLFSLYLGARGAYVTDANGAMDLRPFITDSIRTSFDPNVWAPQGPNGEIFIISPVATTSHLVFANTAIMEELGLELPKTQEELIAQGKIIRDAGYVPLAIGAADDWVMNSVFFSALVGRFGGKEWFDKARTGTASFSDKNFVDALNVIKTLLDNQMFSPGVTQLNYTQGFELYIQGKAVYLIDASWKLNSLIQEAPEIANNTEIILYPAISGETFPNSTSAVYGDHLAINPKLSPEEAEAAFKFIMFHVGEKGSDMKMKSGLITTYKLNPNNYDLHPLTQKYIDIVNNSPKSYVIDAVMDAEGMTVLNPGIQAMMLGQKTAQQVADEYEVWVAGNDSNRG